MPLPPHTPYTLTHTRPHNSAPHNRLPHRLVRLFGKKISPTLSILIFLCAFPTGLTLTPFFAYGKGYSALDEGHHNGHGNHELDRTKNALQDVLQQGTSVCLICIENIQQTEPVS